MPSYAGPSTSRSGDLAGTLQLLAYLALGVVLLVLDHRGGWLSRVRQQAQTLVQPLRAVAGMPGQVVRTVSNDAGTLGQLTVENRRLRNELLVTRARMARLATVNADNARLRALLGAAEQGSLDVQLAPILTIDLDPTRQRLVLGAGSGDGVRVGQTVIDAGGVLGQIIEVGPLQSTVLLLTDPDHAIPVAIARNGVRLVAYGTGRVDQLALASVPLSSEVKVGDVLVTSGLGGRFAAGFPVGTITALRPDESRAFLVGDVKPSAELDRGRDVLLLRTLPSRPVIGPGTVPAAAPVEGAAAPVEGTSAPVEGTSAAGTTPGQATKAAAGAPAPAPAAGTTHAAASRTAQPAATGPARQISSPAAATSTGTPPRTPQAPPPQPEPAAEHR
ncbi:rod shape-determining protein MreC [Lysobacter fragariae]